MCPPLLQRICSTLGPPVCIYIGAWTRISQYSLPCELIKVKHNVALTFLSGFWISGNTAQKGLMTSKNFTVPEKQTHTQKKTEKYINEHL